MAASITISFWQGAKDINPCAWVTIFLVLIVSINLFGVRGYGEAEFVFSVIKVTAVVGFMQVELQPHDPLPSNRRTASWESSSPPEEDRTTDTWAPTIGMAPMPGGLAPMLTRHRYDPGAFSYGFKGLCSVFVVAAFSFAGTELVGLCAAETDNPRKTLPKAAKQVFWRICLVRRWCRAFVGRR